MKKQNINDNKLNGEQTPRFEELYNGEFFDDHCVSWIPFIIIGSMKLRWGGEGIQILKDGSVKDPYWGYYTPKEKDKKRIRQQITSFRKLLEAKLKQLSVAEELMK